MHLFNTLKILRMLFACLMITAGISHEGVAAEARLQRLLVIRANNLAKKAIEAARKGDLTTSQQSLDQIETLSPHSEVKAFIQTSPLVQEARRIHTLQAEQAAIGAATEKAEEEKRLKEKEKEREIANRIAFEKEQAQKQITQRQEDEKNAALRLQQQQHKPEGQQALPQTSHPQTSQAVTHQEGKSFTSCLMDGVISAAKSTNPQTVLGFQTDKPKEASFKAENLGEAALAESETNSASQHLTSSAKDRPTFKFDPNTDPLFVTANQISKNPQQTLNEQMMEVSNSGDIAEEIKTCEEGGDEYQQTCSRHLNITLKITPEEGYKAPKTCIGHWKNKVLGTKWWCSGCRGGNYVITQHKKVDVIREEWADGCSLLENHVEKGLCRYVSSYQSPKNETRTIQEEPVTRDHFEEHNTYACFKTSVKSCAGLREQGCYQIKSICKEKMGEHCVLWEQTFSCPSGKRFVKSYQSSNKANPFCLTGNCADTSYEANGELLSVMSHLQALKEAQNDLRDFKVIFKGQHRWCTRNCLDFRDCCGSGKGWGVTLHLSSCDAKEIELRTLRDKNLCVQIGTYCAERDKVFNTCLRKKTTFCCYGTKMARLIQQSGRAQLGMGFGTPESPNCDGLSPEQLSRIDFSKVDFSEIFADIRKQTVTKDQKQSLAQVSAERLQGNMALLTKPSSGPAANQKIQAFKEKGL